MHKCMRIQKIPDSRCIIMIMWSTPSDPLFNICFSCPSALTDTTLHLPLPIWRFRNVCHLIAINPDLEICLTGCFAKNAPQLGGRTSPKKEKDTDSSHHPDDFTVVVNGPKIEMYRVRRSECRLLIRERISKLVSRSAVLYMNRISLKILLTFFPGGEALFLDLIFIPLLCFVLGYYLCKYLLP
jgi:hypothetical protein